MVGMSVAIFTSAPWTGLPEASLSVTAIVSVPGVGGSGVKAAVTASVPGSADVDALASPVFAEQAARDITITRTRLFLNTGNPFMFVRRPQPGEGPRLRRQNGRSSGRALLALRRSMREHRGPRDRSLYRHVRVIGRHVAAHRHCATLLRNVQRCRARLAIHARRPQRRARHTLAFAYQ